MKNQALFSLKDKTKMLKYHLRQFVFGALRVKYGMWGLLKHEYIPKTQNLPAISTGHTCLFKAKYILKLSCIKNLFQNFWFCKLVCRTGLM